jgi:drug/metabolite transporter (DMT)-like permease
LAFPGYTSLLSIYLKIEFFLILPYFASQMKKAFLYLHISVFLAGFTGPLGRLIDLNEGLLVWWRLFITSVTMWIVFSLMGKLQRITVKDILKLTGIGFLAAIHWVTFYGSIKYANVSVALVCFSAVGFFTALIEPILLRVRIKWIEVALGLMVIAGICMIFHFNPEYKIGIILGLICALLMAFVMICIREFVQRINPQTVLTYQLTGGLLTWSALMPVYMQQFPTDYMFPNFGDWMWLLMLAWLCSVLAFQFSVYALKRLTAFTVNLSFNLEPVYGIFLAIVLFGESREFDWSFFGGLALIATSLLIHVVMLLQKERKIIKSEMNQFTA